MVFCSLIVYPLHKLGQVDPSTGKAEDDGVEDEYQLEAFEVVAADYILKVGVSNFKNAWENMDPGRVDEYGLGPRESLAEAVNEVIDLLGMQPCEVSAFLPNTFTRNNFFLCFGDLGIMAISFIVVFGSN